ncbi:ImmA/IrrE family metallo-endopeptidase [Bacillus sp. REN10]|uniref:ImmA/IrrE family metallo-endopeptidase n=1 Tax=Bacillus sp. REN10 TaxID=2782541 RepID=UPI00193B6BA2|nr:ImmA/IrrE family metallo-endopeptidase [Bacillus sp. REN10]
MAHTTLLEDYIFSLYQSIHIYKPDQLDMKVIAKRLGIDIEYINNSSKTLLGSLETLILIDQRLPPEKQWQDFGHELGHLLRHCGSQLTLPPPFIKMQEWQANNFMYHFCVPSFMLEKLSFPWRKKEVIAVIAHTFNVDIEFATERLERWLRQRESLYFYRQMNEARQNGL